MRCRPLAIKRYPVTVVAPGNDKEEILRAVPELAADFAQTMLLGYPPLLKDLIDTDIGRTCRGHRWLSGSSRPQRCSARTSIETWLSLWEPLDPLAFLAGSIVTG